MYLSQLLADTCSLYLTTHSFHWNVTSPQFNRLHLMLETQYIALLEAAGEIAAATARDTIKSANSAGGEGTADRVTGRLMDHEKTVRMLRLLLR